MLRISSLLPQLRQSFNLKGKATFWFGGIIASIAKQTQKADIQIIKDLDTFSFSQFIHILNQSLSSAMVFYPENPPDNFFKFITFCNQLISQTNQSNSLRDYNFVLAKLSLRNSLIIHSFTIKQYSYVFNSCQQVLNEFMQSKVDSYNQVYLTFFSNFLSIVQKINPTKRNHHYFLKLQQTLSENLKLIFSRIVEKLLRIVNGQGTIDLAQFQLLAAIFTKNKTVLQKKQDHFYKLVEKVILQTKFNALKGSVYVAKIYKERAQKQIILEFEVPYFEFSYFSQNHNLELSKKSLKHLSTNEQTEKDNVVSLIRKNKDMSLNIQSVEKDTKLQSEQTSSLPINRFRRLNYLSQTQKRTSVEVSKTIDVNSGSFENKLLTSREYLTQQNSSIISEKRAPKFSIRHQVTSEMVSPTKMPKNQKLIIARTQTKRIGMNQSLLFSGMHAGVNNRNKNSMHQVLHFKMGSIFIQVNDDGILLSDYTKQNKRYVEWNTVSAILPRFQFKFVYSEYLKYPVFNYYDVIRMIKLYVSKNQNGNICIYEHPNTVLQLNEFVKFYPQEGKYTKLAHMNIYDNSKLEGAIDCYFQEFDHFFKVVSTNGYLNYLSSKIFADIEPETNKNEVFYLEVLRKQKQSTKTELENQLSVDIIENVTGDKNFAHKAIFVLKNNSRIYAKINLAGENSKDEFFQISVRRLNKISGEQFSVSHSVNSTRCFELPYYKILQYMPLYDMDINTYAQRFGRMIFELFNNFEDLSHDMNMSHLQFQIICHFYLTEMIEIGRYFTVVSAQLIGTKNQIFGLVIRYHFLPANKEVITFLINPYYGFLSNFIGLPKEEKRNSYKKLLVNQSVKQTYLYLEKAKKLNQISSLVEYLSEGIGFF